MKLLPRGLVVLSLVVSSSPPCATAAEPAPTAAQAGGAWSPQEPEASAPFRAPTPEERALLDSLVARAQKEVDADTDLAGAVEAAVASANPHLRINAFASLSMAMMSLRSAPGSRGPTRRAALTEQVWPVVLRGLADADASVRRHALITAASLQPSAERAAHLDARADRLFLDDPAGVVRGAAFEWLVRQRSGYVLDMAMVERAIADPSPTVKFAGFNALWLRQSPGYLPFMLAKLHDERDSGTRVAAAEALRSVVPIDSSVVDAVAARLAVETDPRIRARMNAALTQMKALAASVKKPDP